jgi:hypothetical protein
MLFRRFAYDAVSGPMADFGEAARQGSAAIVCVTRGCDDSSGYDPPGLPEQVRPGPDQSPSHSARIHEQ